MSKHSIIIVKYVAIVANVFPVLITLFLKLPIITGCGCSERPLAGEPTKMLATQNITTVFKTKAAT